MPSDDLFTREEALTGLPARRARTLLFLIESRTAHLAAQSRQAAIPIPTERTTEELDLAFLEAFTLGREPPVRVTIQEVERYASQWAHLVPENPQVRAAVAHFLGQKYDFTHQAVPGIRAVLDLDAEAVQQAHLRLYRQPLENVFAARPTLAHRWRWAWAALAGWLESLPPFWTAFAISLPIGAFTLALPIAVADVGPLVGVALMVVLGLINILTIAAISEAVARSGVIHYGNAFLGRVVADYLGSIASFIFTSVLGGIFFMLLLVFYIGVATTLADATPVRAEVWTALLFLVGLYFLSRQSFNATVASTLVARAITIGLLLILSGLAFAHLKVENLSYTNLPFVGGRAFEPALLQLIFGTIMSAYLAHPAVGNIATITLRRDPSGRSLIWGNVAAIAVTLVVSSVWILAVNGAIAPQSLIGQTGTALAPLAAMVGPNVHLLGSIFAILSMGMGSIIISLGLFYLIRERLPARSRLLDQLEHDLTLEALEASLEQRSPEAQSSKSKAQREQASRGALRQAQDRQAEQRGRGGRFLASISPVVIAFVLTEWMFVTDSGSYARLISFLGVIATSLLGGIFPVLLLVAGRRKGEYLPGTVYRFLAHPLLVAGAYFLFLAILFIHGLILWQSPLERAGALLVGIVMLGATVIMVRRGAFARRAVVELREDQRQGKQSAFNVVVDGRPATAEVRLGYPSDRGGEQRCQAASGTVPAFSSLRYAAFQLPATPAAELKVWAHRITPAGDSRGLPALLEVHRGGESAQARTEQFDLRSSDGQIVLPFSGEACRLRITLIR
jgi:amino acid permease